MKSKLIIIFLFCFHCVSFSQNTKADSVSILGQRFVGTRPFSLLSLAPSFFIGKRLDKDTFNVKKQSYALLDFQYNAGIIMMANFINDNIENFHLKSPFSGNINFSLLETKKKKSKTLYNEFQAGVSINYAKFKEKAEDPFSKLLIMPIGLNYKFGIIRQKGSTFTDFGALMGISLLVVRLNNLTIFKIEDVPLIFPNIGLQFRIGTRIISEFKFKEIF